MSHESEGKTNEWYTPEYIFDALKETFDTDVSPARYAKGFVPAYNYLDGDGLMEHWNGFVWMNPPFGGRNGLIPWMEKFFNHGNGIALTPDRTSAEWWQVCAKRADAILFIAPKVKFVRPDGSLGKSPSNGTTLFASGKRGADSLLQAGCLGLILLNPIV
jgi:hypothetical protein